MSTEQDVSFNTSHERLKMIEKIGLIATFYNILLFDSFYSVPQPPN